jgi:hypothetical protein
MRRAPPSSRQPPNRASPTPSRTPARGPGLGTVALGAGALMFLPNLFSGFLGGGGGSPSGGGGGVGDIIALLPVMMVGGGALYAISVFKK